MSGYPKVLDLGDLGAGGVVFAGVAGDGLYDSRGMGDINGDGFDDFQISAGRANEAYIVFGGANLAQEMDASDLDGDHGFGISNISPLRVVPAGDFNGDGLADLSFELPFQDYSTHLTRVLYGSGDFDPLIAPPSTDDADSVSFAVGGHSISGLGDVDGDGFDDIATCFSRTYGGDFGYWIGGEVTIEFGHAEGGAARSVVLSKSQDYGNDGIFLSARSGDFNGDGFDDLLVHGDHDWLIFGGPDLQTMSIDGLAPEKGFAIDGFPTRAAGDINGDGFDDLCVKNSVIFGHAGPGVDIDPISLDGTNGFTVVGAGGLVLENMVAVGDVNGDGFDDLAFSTAAADDGGTDRGATYIVFGRGKPFDATYVISRLNGNNGFEIIGAQKDDEAHGTYAAAGDVNGDGLADILIGAQGANAGGLDSGAVYIVYGIGPDAAVKRIGSGGDQNLVGGAFDDKLSGMGGNDTLWGNGGKDRLDGGDGADLLRSGDGKDNLAGGEGSDTLIGGGGRDRMAGGAGSNTYQFDRVGDSKASQFDIISDIQAGDHLDLSAIDANTTMAGDQAFKIVKAFNGHAGQVTLTYNSFANTTLLEADVDGDKHADFAVMLNGDQHAFTGLVL